jgi:hypothetical protein
VFDDASGGLPVALDSSAASFLKDHTYLAQTAGFVTMFATSNTTTEIAGYIGTTTDPVGAGIKVSTNTQGTNSKPSISFLVGRGLYFELTAVIADSALGVWWTPLISGGAAPIDIGIVP